LECNEEVASFEIFSELRTLYVSRLPGVAKQNVPLCFTVLREFPRFHSRRVISRRIVHLLRHVFLICVFDFADV